MSDPARAIALTDSVPFAHGQRVYEGRRPENGSLTVDECRFHGDHWRVAASIHVAPGMSAIIVSAPAEDFALCPDGWREPPPCPAESLGYDAASDVRRAELREDAVYQARIRKWGESLARWRRAVFRGGATT